MRAARRIIRPEHAAIGRTRARAAVISVLTLALTVVAPTSAQTSALSDDDLTVEANGFYQVQDWVAAADAYQELTARNPLRAQWWFQLGLCYHNLNRFEESIPAFERCDEIGMMREASRYNIACGHAQLGQADEALHWLDQAIRARFRRTDLLRGDTDLDPIRDDERFRLLAGLEAPPGASRAEGWSFDLDVLALRIDQLHPSPYLRQSRDALRLEFDALVARVDTLTDPQIAFEVQRVLARIGDGQTRVRRLTAPPRGFRRYPIRLRQFTDGILVVEAAPEHEDLLGLEVVSIDGVPVEDAATACLPFVSRDNEVWARWFVPEWQLSGSDALHAAGVTASPTEATFTLARADGRGLSRTLPALPKAEEIDWVRLVDRVTGPAPRHWRDRERPYWWEFLEDERVLYLAWNAVEVDGWRSWRRFVQRVRSELETRDAAALVIDMRNNRNNYGVVGRADLADRLIDRIRDDERVNRAGRLYVLVGRETFAAALRAALRLERETSATFVGEPTGGAPNHVGDSVLITLPGHGLQVSIGQEYFDAGGASDRRRSLVPEVVVEPSMAHARGNADPALDAILMRIRAESSSATPGGDGE